MLTGFQSTIIQKVKMMNETIKISIVMPVYNTPEKILREPVHSVLNQTYNTIELIIVDDGSKPECRGICDEIKKTDTRIVVLHQTNSGVSSARNNGTKAATGDYVMYMDSDDILGSLALEEGVAVIQNTNADFAFAAIQHIRDFKDFKGTTGGAVKNYILYEKGQIDEVRHSFLTQRNPHYNKIMGTGFVNRGPCARLVKNKIAKSVTFNENLKIGEDVEWNMRVLSACTSVVFVPSIWYGYLIYGSSSLRKYYGNRAQLLETYLNELYSNNKEYCDKHPDDFALNLAVSFYSMVHFEYLSQDSPLGMANTNKEIKSLLQQKPWNVLADNERISHFPLRYRVFFMTCRCGIGASFLKLWEGLTRWKKKLR